MGGPLFLGWRCHWEAAGGQIVEVRAESSLHFCCCLVVSWSGAVALLTSWCEVLTDFLCEVLRGSLEQLVVWKPLEAKLWVCKSLNLASLHLDCFLFYILWCESNLTAWKIGEKLFLLFSSFCLLCRCHFFSLLISTKSMSKLSFWCLIFQSTNSLQSYCCPLYFTANFSLRHFRTVVMEDVGVSQTQTETLGCPV